MYKSYFFLEGEPHTDAFRYAGKYAQEAWQDVLPKAKGFVQTRTLPEQITDATPPYTGAVEVWFDDPDLALDSAPQAQAIADLLSAGTRVGPITTGMARTVMRLPEHHHGQFIKGVFPFRKISSLSVAEFQRYWWVHHGPIAALTEQAVYYLQCHPLPQTYAAGRPPYDGVTELHWPTVEAARAAMASRQMTEDQSNDAKNFAEPGSVVLFLAEEEIVYAP